MKTYSITIDFEGPDEGIVPVNEGDPDELDVIERKLRALLANEITRLNEQDRRIKAQAIEPVFKSERLTLKGKETAEEFAAFMADRDAQG